MRKLNRSHFALILAAMLFCGFIEAEVKMSSQDQAVSEKSVKILYTNWRGEKSWRTIVPESIYFGSTDWHPEQQWLLRALDIEKNASRDFAMKDIASWETLSH